MLCWCLCSQIIGSSFNNEGRSALVNWKQANRGVKWRDENCSNSSSNIQTVDYESHDNAILELEKEVKPSNGNVPLQWDPFVFQRLERQNPICQNLTIVNFPSCIIALWLQSLICFHIPGILSSPRTESARAVAGRRCPHSGVGEDFLERRPGSPHENGRNSGTKSRRLDPLVSKFA